MADNNDYGFGSLGMTAPLAWQLARGIGRYGVRVGSGIMASPLSAAGSFLYGMGDLKGNATTTANKGEKDIYVRNPDGGYMLNPDNPMVSMGRKSPMSPFPASYPFPTMPNGMNPSDPSITSAPAMAAAAPPAAATPGPSSLPGGAGPPNVFDPLYAPLMAGPTGGFSKVNPAAPEVNMSAKSQPTPAPNFYNGPGSDSFGAGDGSAPGGGIGSFMNMLNGGPQTSNPFGNGLLGKLATAQSKLGGLFGTSQYGPTFANGTNGMMGGVSFPIF